MIPILLSITQGDYGFEWLFTLTDSQSAPLVLTNATINFCAELVSDPTVKFTGGMQVIDVNAGTCSYTPASTDFEVAGTYSAQIKVAQSGKIYTFPADGYISIEVTDRIPQT